MTIDAPLLDRRNADEIVTQVENALVDCGWRKGQEGKAGWTLVRLFARLSELVINRLNQVPEKHFLAFLNEAGVDLLPPRPAGVELTFNPAEDGPASIYVPAGTQVATVQTETQPEVIFETSRDITVVANTLVKCIAFDQLNYSDQTAKVTGQESGSFAAFKGEHERQRILYLGDDELFTFPDDVSRKAARITLEFKFSTPGDPTSDGWELYWLYWDGAKWAGLVSAGAGVSDDTDGFSKNGIVVLTKLPELTKSAVGGESALWIACKLTGGNFRRNLPVLSSVKEKRNIVIDSQEVTPDTVLSAIHSGTAFVPLDPAGEFFPLGQRPARLDAFYLQNDEAFNKQGATVSFQINLKGIDTGITSSELDDLTIEWEYYSKNGWSSLGASTKTGVTLSKWDFKDTTNAFTKSIAQGVVSFTVPGDFDKIKVNDQDGYWVRARVAKGSYDVPGGMQKVNGGDCKYEWIEPKTYPPLIKRLDVKVTGYSEPAGDLKTISSCRSQVDGRNLNHSKELTGDQSFSPFSAAEEGLGIYLGFKQAFSAGKWIQLLLDVEEKSQTDEKRSQIFWEYWNGSQWLALRISDGTQGLRQRGYLGFFGPEDPQSNTEFDQNAYWLRARPYLPPLANAGGDQEILSEDDRAKVTLDASASLSFDRQRKTARYIWRLAPSANAGDNQKKYTSGDRVTVTLDASGSIPKERIAKYIWRQALLADAGNDREKYTSGDMVAVTLNASGSTPKERIVKYIWRMAGQKEQKDTEDGTTVITPYLKVIRQNTIPAVNAVTIRDEVLGSSDGKPDQVFMLLHLPVLSGAQIAVREPDRPSEDELKQLRKELQKVDKSAQALLSAPDTASEKGVWVRWHQVSDFYASGPAGRHFTLDPIEGRVGFGDGKRGKIPPVGHDNIKAVSYRNHDGINGNAAIGTITALRNPSGDLANIKSVTNYEKAAGGSDAETVDEVKLRGPQRLKHRQRAVTIEDFAWLAREASGEVGQARCLPTRDCKGLPKAGWVTVVITPKSKVAKPTPSPALLRCVEGYLKNRTLTNLKNVDHIYVKGPEYIEATVLAKVVPSEPKKSDDVELAILKRLETFLDPLRGGPDRTGWKLGRDVYLSEVYAEIEAVPGVDHAGKLRLQASQQQYDLYLAKEGGEYRKIPFDIPIGSQVSTFDKRIRLVLARPVFMKSVVLKDLAVYGLKAGDKVDIVADNNTVLKGSLTIASLVDDKIKFVESFDLSADWDPPADALMAADERIRLPLAQNGITKKGGKVTGVTVHIFNTDDKVSVVVGTRRDPVLEFLPIKQVNTCEDRIFVPEGHLIYSGNHDIEMILE